MTAILLDLDAYVVTDTGEVIVRYPALISRLRDGETIEGLCTFPHEDVDLYNQRNPQRTALRIVEIDGVPGCLPERLYKWNTPPEYREIDLIEHLAAKLDAMFDDVPYAYVDRVSTEIQMMLERGMEDFLRLLIYIVDTFDKHGVVYGVGRGSACASLVLYLIGIHLVDPIEYEIAIGEFLR